MLTVILKRNAEPTVIQMTQEAVMRELSSLNNSEMLLEDNWVEGLKKVRTPYVCLIEADCVLSSSYFSSNVGLMKKTTQSPKGGGYNKLAMIASCLGVRTFDNRIYNYEIQQGDWRDGGSALIKHYEIQPSREKHSTKLYHAQIGYVPGAIIRMAAVDKKIDELLWDYKNLVEMSTRISLHFWNTGRRVQVNPNTTYVSNFGFLEKPSPFKFEITDTTAHIFQREGI